MLRVIRLPERLTTGGIGVDEADDCSSAVSERLRFWPTDFALRKASPCFEESPASLSEAFGMSWGRGSKEKCRAFGVARRFSEPE